MTSSTERLDPAYFVRLRNAIDECGVLGFGEAPDIWAEKGLDDLPITQWGPMVWSAPVLYPEECEGFVDLARKMAAEFSPNEQEDKSYQIDEYVLDPSSLTGSLAEYVLHTRLALVFQAMTGLVPGSISSIQLARFRPETTPLTDWHIDRESEMSCVVSLAPERHEGGGTVLRPWGPAGETLVVPPLPKGHALFFNGRYVHHKALPVVNGERLLLVYWLMGKDVAPGA